MPEPTKLPENTPPTTVEFQFDETPKVQPCSINTCTNGHEWTPEVAIAKCPGCQAPIIVVKMTQCPICNEPVAKAQFRSDHLPKGGVITPICRGSQSMAEVTKIEMERHHYTHEQENHKVREMPAKL